jgi:hypothetical protein
MAITQVNKSKGRTLSGFSSKDRRGANKNRMGDFFVSKSGQRSRFSDKDPFSTRTRRSGSAKEHSEFNFRSSRKRMFKEYDEFAMRANGRGRYFEKDEFAMRSQRKGRFRSYDEFATRTQRAKRFRDFDEFAFRSGNRNGYRDKDEFATRNNRTRKVNTDSQFHVRTTVKRFNRGKRQHDEFAMKRARNKQNRREYTPFATTTQPNASANNPRSPQMGLWGGSVGNRSGKDRRPQIPLPDVSAKKEE